MDHYGLVRWGKSMNVASMRQRLYYHGKEIVLGGDAYAHVWETIPVTHCDVLKVPHHASLSSTTRKLLSMLNPRTAVVSVAARRPDERPHPYIISLLKEFTEDVRFTDAVEIPGLVEPEFHESVHIELE
jgi:beta-lactamase superfamily II metal-dependent hydrolase